MNRADNNTKRHKTLLVFEAIASNVVVSADAASVAPELVPPGVGEPWNAVRERLDSELCYINAAGDALTAWRTVNIFVM